VRSPSVRLNPLARMSICMLRSPERCEVVIETRF
jgi:hypothetical protein